VGGGGADEFDIYLEPFPLGESIKESGVHLRTGWKNNPPRASVQDPYTHQKGYGSGALPPSSNLRDASFLGSVC
jgi:hypothetical protein